MRVRPQAEPQGQQWSSCSAGVCPRINTELLTRRTQGKACFEELTVPEDSLCPPRAAPEKRHKDTAKPGVALV